MAVYQCLRFLSNPKLTYERAITRIGRYLIKTIEKGLICKVNKLKGLEYYTDTDFARG